MSEMLAEDVCSTCQQPLHVSVIIGTNGLMLKRRSSDSDSHVFYI